MNGIENQNGKTIEEYKKEIIEKINCIQQEEKIKFWHKFICAIENGEV